MAKDAPAYSYSQVWNLICVMCLIELKERGQGKVPELEAWVAERAPKHIEQFVEGTGFYEHPACVALRDQYTFKADPASFATGKQLTGRSIIEKAKSTERSMRNELVPCVYQCTESLELRSNSYTFKSGKGPKEFELELKRRLWTAGGQAGVADGTETMSKYHSCYFAFVCTTVASYYLYNIEGLSVYKDMILPSTAMTDDGTGRGKGRIAQRAEAKKPRLSETAGAASIGSRSTSTSAAAAYVRSKDREQRMQLLSLLANNGNEQQKARALASAEKMLDMMEQEEEKPEAPTPQPQRETPSSEVRSGVEQNEDTDGDI